MKTKGTVKASATDVMGVVPGLLPIHHRDDSKDRDNRPVRITPATVVLDHRGESVTETLPRV